MAELAEPARSPPRRGGDRQPLLRPVRAGRAPPRPATPRSSPRPAWPSTPRLPGRGARRAGSASAEPTLRDALAQIRLAYVQIAGGRQRRARAGRVESRADRRHQDARRPSLIGGRRRHQLTGPQPSDAPAARVAGRDDVQVDLRSPSLDATGCRRRSRCSGTGAPARRRRSTVPSPLLVEGARSAAPEAGASPTASRSPPIAPTCVINGRSSRGELEDVGGALVLERRDEGVDLRLRHHRLDRVAAVARRASETVGDFIDGSTAITALEVALGRR